MSQPAHRSLALPKAGGPAQAAVPSCAQVGDGDLKVPGALVDAMRGPRLCCSSPLRQLAGSLIAS